jgi:Cu/Ag efflux pump CusA
MQWRQRFITLKRKVLNYWQWSVTGGLMNTTVLNLLALPALFLRYGKFDEQEREW